MRIVQFQLKKFQYGRLRIFKKKKLSINKKKCYENKNINRLLISLFFV